MSSIVIMHGLPRARVSIGLTAVTLAMSPLAVLAQEAPRAATGDPMQFDRSLVLDARVEDTANVSIGDVDGDGHLDVVLVKGRHGQLENLLMRGDGRGGFDPARPLGSPADRSYSGVLVDLDADGDLDIVVSNDRPDPKVAYLNDGRGNFSAGSTFGRPEWPTRHVRVADFNGDHFPDVVLANRYGPRGGQNYVCFGEDGGRFSEPCLGFSAESATTVTPADFDGDGRTDLAVPHRDGGQSHIYLNEGATFARRIAFGPPDAAIRSAEAADLDGDGRLDLAAIDQRRGPVVLWGRGTASFEPAVPLGDSEATPYAIAVADLDRDGVLDILIGNIEARPVAYFGTSDRGFLPVPFGDAGGVGYGFDTADVDGDGFVDIAMARSGAPNMIYFGGPATAVGQGNGADALSARPE